MQLILKPGTSWVDTYRRYVEVAPAAFHQDRVLNLWGGEWHRDGVVAPATSSAHGSRAVTDGEPGYYLDGNVST